MYEDQINKRAGRWIQRYPQLDAQLGQRFYLFEVVEEVFLNAFERFEQRPAVTLGEWLEGLIDESVRTLLEHPDLEKQNVSFLQTLQEMHERGEDVLAPQSPGSAGGEQ
jgi:hypothetical protein